MIELADQIALRGRIAIEIRENGLLVAREEESNVICAAGLAQVALAAAWSMAQDQNTAMGNPLDAVDLFPIYGAVGSSSTTPSGSDIQLGAELGRSVVTYANASAGVVLLTFFFTTTASDWTISEAGVFVQASATTNSGQLLNHALVGPVTKTAAQTATMQVTFTF